MQSMTRTVAWCIAITLTACIGDTTGPNGGRHDGPSFDQTPTETTLQAVRDAYVVQGIPDGNRGNKDSLILDTKTWPMVAFDQSAITAAVGSGTLTAAKIRLTVGKTGTNWGTNGGPIDLKRLTSTWTELGATWNCAIDSIPSNSSKDCTGATEWLMGSTLTPPWASPASGQQTIVNSQTGVVEFDVTSDVQGFLGGTLNNGWLLKRTTESGTSGRIVFMARETAAKPQLVLTITPAAPPTPPAEIAPTRDAYVVQAIPDGNRGNKDSLILDTKTWPIVAFDQSAISSAAAGRQVIIATLRFTIGSTGTNWGTTGRTIDLNRLTQDWTELGATWNCAIDATPANSAKDCVGTAEWTMASTTSPPWSSPRTAQATITNGLTGTVDFDVTADINAFLNGTPNYGWLLKRTSESTSGRVVFMARQVTAAPKLVLTFASSVPTSAPDTIPEWVYSDTNIVTAPGTPGGAFLKRILIVEFRPEATAQQRSQAINGIGGQVVGGASLPEGEGYYYVSIDGAVTDSALLTASDALSALPYVRFASPEIGISPNYRLAVDGPGDWRSWTLDPDSAAGDNWALEQIAAPAAWGCSTGDASTRVALIDLDFTRPADIAANLQIVPGTPVTRPGAALYHGIAMASVLGAVGNNGTGMTGVMWRADVRGYDYGAPGKTDRTDSLFWARRAMTALKKAAIDGAKIINISNGMHWGGVPTATDSTGYAWQPVKLGSWLKTALEALENGSPSRRPLVVLSAGNDGIDAWWNGFSQAVTATTVGDQILVVGGTNTAQDLYGIAGKGSDYGDLLSVAAPGENVTMMSSTGTPGTSSGTSASASIVSGIAGLLLSFDPRLTGQELKEYIIAGAQRGGRVAGSSLGGPPVVIANAYESLKAAAERPKAPLCGNLIRSLNGQVIVSRGSASDTIGPILSHRYPSSEHGGKTVGYVTDLRDDGLIIQPALHWTPSSLWQPALGSEPAYHSENGTLLSLFQISHDQDSSVYAPEDTAGLAIRIWSGLRNGSTQGRTLTHFPVTPGQNYVVAWAPTGGDIIVHSYKIDGITGHALGAQAFYSVSRSTGTPIPLFSLPANDGLGSGLAITEDRRYIIVARGNPNFGSGLPPSCWVDVINMGSGTTAATYPMDCADYSDNVPIFAPSVARPRRTVH